MFRAAYRSLSGAPNSICSLWFICTCGDRLLSRLGGNSVPTQPGQRPVTINSGIIPYILESNPHPFYSFRGLKNQKRIIIACGLGSQLRAGFWKNDGAAVRAVRTIQYNNLLFYLLLIIIIYYSSDSPSSLITESLSVLRRDCARLLRKTRFTVLV